MGVELLNLKIFIAYLAGLRPIKDETRTLSRKTNKDLFECKQHLVEEIFSKKIRHG